MWKITVFAIVVVASVCGRELPSSYKKCQLRKSDECWVAAVAKALVNLKTGIPEISLPTADPLEIPAITIGEGTGAVHVVQNYQNLKLYGMTNSSIVKANTSEVANGHIVVETFSPFVYFDADYDFDGQILVIPMRGRGKCRLNFNDLKTIHTLDYELFERNNGRKYWKVNQYNLQLSPGKVHYEFDNLFNGNAQLGDNLNRVLNENWKEVFDDVRSGYETTFGEVFKNYANQFFKHYSTDELFSA